MLDYQCYPIWIYDENGDFIDNDLIEEIKSETRLIQMLDELQNKFESLYINNTTEFKYIGFNSEVDKKNFQEKVNEVYNFLCELLGEKYIIKNFVKIE